MNAQNEFNKGVAWARGGERIRAIESFRRGVLDDPANSVAWYMLGTLCHEIGDSFNGVLALNKAVELAPGLVDAHVNRAAAYISLGRLREAEQAADEALANNALNPFALGNKAHICMLSGRRHEAADWYFKQMQVCAPEARNGIRGMRGLALLGAGNLKEGWAECYPHWHNPSVNPFRKRPLKSWDGKSKENLLLVTDQGYGDIIQFMRYVPMLKERTGAKVYVETMRPLARLCSVMPGVDKALVLGDDDAPDDVETFVSVATLPYFLGTDRVHDIPWPGPYINGKGIRSLIWAEQLKAARVPSEHAKIGILWATGERIDAAAQESMRRKSLSLTDFAPLAKVPGVTFVSLQVGDYALEAMNPPKGLPLIDLHDDITDFFDTAAFIENLDLVISPCTAVAHLAAAMGKPTWLLLHNCGDWRWLQDRRDSPWYPSLRIFQQPKWGDWKSVMLAVASELYHRVSQSKAA